jgi:hypothetical protein
MKSKSHLPKLGATLTQGLFVITLAACGGGGGSGGSTTATYGGVKGNSCTGTHGPGQTAFESVVLASNGGFYGANWFLPNSGPATAAFHSLDSVITTIPASPDTGAQLVTQVVGLGSNTLPAQTPILKKSRVLALDGNIRYVQTEPIKINGRVTYNCDDTILQTVMSDDGFKVAEETIHSIQTVALAGPVFPLNALTTLVPPLDSGFRGFINYVNPGLLNSTSTASYQAGAKFLNFKKTAFTDIYKIRQCTIASTLLAATDPDACGLLDTTLLPANQFSDALIKIGVPTPSTTGVFSTVFGAQVWKETAVVPVGVAGASTDTHRFAVAVNGELFVGRMVAAGTAIWDDEEYPHSLGSTQPTSIWHRHANKQTADSIKQILNF